MLVAGWGGFGRGAAWRIGLFLSSKNFLSVHGLDAAVYFADTLPCCCDVVIH